MSTLLGQEGFMWGVDDVSGAQLEVARVKEARKLELKYFKEMKVYDVVPRADLICSIVPLLS